MSVLLLTAVLALQTMPTPDNPRWLRVGGNDEGEYAIDPASISRRGDRVRVYIRLRLTTPTQDGVSLGVLRYDYDCRANTIRSEVVEIYSDQGFVATVPTPEAELSDEPIGADSPNATVRDYLCAR